MTNNIAKTQEMAEEAYDKCPSCVGQGVIINIAAGGLETCKNCGGMGKVKK